MHSRTSRSILPGKIFSNSPNISDLVSSNGNLDVLECATQYVFMPNSHYPLVDTSLSPPPAPALLLGLLGQSVTTTNVGQQLILYDISTRRMYMKY